MVSGDVREVNLPVGKQDYLADSAVVIAACMDGGMVRRLMEYISDEYLGCDSRR